MNILESKISEGREILDMGSYEPVMETLIP